MGEDNLSALRGDVYDFVQLMKGWNEVQYAGVIGYWTKVYQVLLLQGCEEWIDLDKLKMTLAWAHGKTVGERTSRMREDALRQIFSQFFGELP